MKYIVIFFLFDSDFIFLIVYEGNLLYFYVFFEVMFNYNLECKIESYKGCFMRIKFFF